jgi:glucosamine-6-phosphate deaminase
VRIIILDDGQAVAQQGADLLSQQLQKKADSVLGFASGSTPIELYQELIKRHQRKLLNFNKCTSFNLDEYVRIGPNHPQSYRYFMQRHLFDHTDIEPLKTHLPVGNGMDNNTEAETYDQLVATHGGIDLQVLGIGRNNHIGFNEPSSSLSSRYRVKTLTSNTVVDYSHFFNDGEYQPRCAITLGIANILEGPKVVLLATGSGKSEAVKAMIEGPVSSMRPASALQMHKKLLADNNHVG